MRPYGLAISLVVLTLIQGAGVEAGTLQLQVQSGRISIRAHAVELGEVLEALSERTGMRMIIDEDKAAQRVSAVIEAEGVREAISELLRRTGGGTHVILYTDDTGRFETFRFTEGGESPPSPKASLPAPGGEFGEPGGEASRLGSPGLAPTAGADAGPSAANAGGTESAPPEVAGAGEPRFVPPRSEPGYVAPASPPVPVPEATAPVYIAPAAEPQYVPELPSRAPDSGGG